ncbi:hypothetical protein DQF64_00490 [Moraxella bovis]|nr:hypothetical protein DQF64_00490 [Moraxella bovis]
MIVDMILTIPPNDVAILQIGSKDMENTMERPPIENEKFLGVGHEPPKLMFTEFVGIGISSISMSVSFLSISPSQNHEAHLQNSGSSKGFSSAGLASSGFFSSTPMGLTLGGSGLSCGFGLGTGFGCGCVSGLGTGFGCGFVSGCVSGFVSGFAGSKISFSGE